MSRSHPFPARRIFLVQAASSAGLLCSAGLAHAQAKKVEETDETAIGLGYRHDTTQVDGKKYPQHKPDQKCSNCSFWQGAPTDEWAGCSMFGRKHVANKGWCLAWRKI